MTVKKIMLLVAVVIVTAVVEAKVGDNKTKLFRLGKELVEPEAGLVRAPEPQPKVDPKDPSTSSRKPKPSSGLEGQLAEARRQAREEEESPKARAEAVASPPLVKAKDEGKGGKARNPPSHSSVTIHTEYATSADTGSTSTNSAKKLPAESAEHSGWRWASNPPVS